MKLVPRLCSPVPIPRRVASRFSTSTYKVRWGTAPSAAQQDHSENACTCISIERVFKAIVVIQSVIVDTEIVTAAAARALIAKVRCVTHRVFQQRGKMVKVDADVLSLSRLFGRRVASILMSASPAVTDDLYRRKEEASPMVLGHRLPPGVHRKVKLVMSP